MEKKGFIWSMYGGFVLICMIIALAAGCRSVTLESRPTVDVTAEKAEKAQRADSEKESQTALSTKLVQNIRIGFSQVGEESAWRLANSKSIVQSAKDAGIELDFREAGQQQVKQIEAIRAFIASKVDVIAFSPVVQSGWEPVLKEAKEAGIPVVVTDRSIDAKDTSLYVSYIGSDFYAEGEKAGKYLLDKISGTEGIVRIVELQGTRGSAPSVDRKKGFENMIKRNPRLQIIRSEVADFTRENGKSMMADMLRDKGKEIKVLFSHNDDMALGAIEAIEEFGLVPGKDIIIISVDGSRKAFEKMAEGKINCVVECNPLFGPQLMQAVKELHAGRILPKRILTKEGVFTEETAERELMNRKY